MRQDVRLGALVTMAALVGAPAYAQEPANPLFAACENHELTDDERVDSCSAFLASEPDAAEQARAFEIRGYIYYQKSELDRAIDDYNRAVALDAQLDPRRAHRASLYFNRGRIRAQRREFAAAVEDFQRAASINGTWSDPLSWSAKIRSRNLGDRDGALSDIEAALRRSPDDEGLLELRCEISMNGGRADALAAPCPGVGR
jgi:tetratricopeptide (TPR) repeat protein